MSTNTAITLPQIGRYELLTQLGEGGMARVFLALSRGRVGWNKLVVIKQLRPELATDGDFLGMFTDEARLAGLLNHPNIVQTYEIFSEEGLGVAGRHMMAMEYLEGQSLAEVLKRVGRDRMPLEEHIWLLTKVLAGLHYAHELLDYDGAPLGIVHRDVSPSNVFVNYDGQVKLVDFGIAKASGAISSTARGTVKAKLGYGAPEQFLGLTTDARADLFSVGVMLWEALAGCRRKIGETRNAMIEARVTGQEPSIRSIRPDVPPALAAICDRATALDPEHRHGSAAELAYDLQRWLDGRSRRVSERELGSLVSRAFAAERMAIRLKVERAVSGARADSAQNAPARDASALMSMDDVSLALERLTPQAPGSAPIAAPAAPAPGKAVGRAARPTPTGSAPAPGTPTVRGLPALGTARGAEAPYPLAASAALPLVPAAAPFPLASSAALPMIPDDAWPFPAALPEGEAAAMESGSGEVTVGARPSRPHGSDAYHGFGDGYGDPDDDRENRSVHENFFFDEGIEPRARLQIALAWLRRRPALVAGSAAGLLGALTLVLVLGGSDAPDRPRVDVARVESPEGASTAPAAAPPSAVREEGAVAPADPAGGAVPAPSDPAGGAAAAEDPGQARRAPAVSARGAVAELPRGDGATRAGAGQGPAADSIGDGADGIGRGQINGSLNAVSPTAGPGAASAIAAGEAAGRPGAGPRPEAPALGRPAAAFGATTSGAAPPAAGRPTATFGTTTSGAAPALGAAERPPSPAPFGSERPSERRLRAIQPGEDLRRPINANRPRRQLDEQDPY